MGIKIDLTNTKISEEKISNIRPLAQRSLELLYSNKLNFTGWVNYPSKITKGEINEILSISHEIKNMSKYFLVLGTGGSFMGSKAAVDLLAPNSPKTKVLFAGHNFSAKYIKSILNIIGDDDFSVCVISKSGTTIETLSSFEIVRQIMLDKYGKKEASNRTFVITEPKNNYLYKLAEKENFKIIPAPFDIGGRYSVLTVIGLLPMAVCGINIEELIKGAGNVSSLDSFKHDSLDYAITRQVFEKSNKTIEVFEFFNPYFEYFGEWLKQLFGESEGKDGKGLFPTSLMFSRDLHSMGQFLQEGTPSFFETMITVDEPSLDFKIPDSATELFAGKTIEQINNCAKNGVLAAHSKSNIPIISISVPKLTENSLGELLYFFQIQCGVSALLSKVDPFNQPGVEKYKNEMKAYISNL